MKKFICLIVVVLALVTTLTSCAQKVSDATIYAEGVSRVSKITITAENIESGESIQICLKRKNAYSTDATYPEGMYRVNDVETHVDCDYECVFTEDTFVISNGSETALRFETKYIGASIEWFVRNNALLIFLLVAVCISYFVIVIKRKHRKGETRKHE